MDRRASATRQALLDSAQTLFAERGFDAVATRELVERAGANIAAISYHFGSKRALYLETVRGAMHDERFERAWSELDGPFTKPADAARALAVFVRAFLPGLLEDRELNACSCLMLREAMQPSEALDDVLRQFIEPREQALEDAIRAARPELKPKEARLCARSLFGQLLHQHLFRPFFEGLRGRPHAKRDVQAITDHVIRFSLRGIGLRDAQITKALASSARPTPDA
ncbi:HTH-type transcriptional repressor KstR2 [Planctomycetes bacterium Pla163]|uniref:HTH-type transcriptional repressor KstR2 n=1 Tax=Rohdeia mirabilis TaxID=2528008 RepID=A0A518CWC8_9BACT|nr:HTH-type transcriptional repressor KstR2 [Planctomycetes bacterium Pla163]